MLSSNEIFIANEVTNATSYDSVYVINIIDAFFVRYKYSRNNYFFFSQSCFFWNIFRCYIVTLIVHIIKQFIKLSPLIKTPACVIKFNEILSLIYY